MRKAFQCRVAHRRKRRRREQKGFHHFGSAPLRVCLPESSSCQCSAVESYAAGARGRGSCGMCELADWSATSWSVLRRSTVGEPLSKDPRGSSGHPIPGSETAASPRLSESAVGRTVSARDSGLKADPRSRPPSRHQPHFQTPAATLPLYAARSAFKAALLGHQPHLQSPAARVQGCGHPPPRYRANVRGAPLADVNRPIRVPTVAPTSTSPG